MEKVFIIAQKEKAHTDAVAAGVQLAKAMDKHAEVFAYCFEYFSNGFHYNPRLAAVSQQKAMEQTRAKFEAELKELNAEDVPLHMVWSKDLYEHACHHSLRHGFDLMVKAVHHAEHYHSTDWHLIRHVKMPLLLLTENPLHRSNAVLMAVDLGSDNPLKQKLNQAVISHGKALAHATGSKLHLAYVIRVPKVLRDMDLINTRTLVKKAYQTYQEQLVHLGLDANCIHMIAGDPDLCLYELACRLKSRYLVIGARQRRGILGRIIGNTVESILSRIRSNVLVIPADDQLLAPLNPD